MEVMIDGVRYVPKVDEKQLWTTTYKCGDLEVSGHIEGLYTLNEAMRLKLPEEWRIPSDYDWFRIEHFFNNDAKEMIKRLGLELTGLRDYDGSLSARGSTAFLWSSSESGSTAWSRYLYSTESRVNRCTNDKAYGFSVRAVRDIESEEI